MYVRFVPTPMWALEGGASSKAGRPRRCEESKIGKLKRGAAIAALSLVAAGGAVAAASAAEASGYGNEVGGCQARYWSTAFSTECLPATVSAEFQTMGVCTAQSNRFGTWQWVGVNSNVTGVSGGECTWSVTDAEVNAR